MCMYEGFDFTCTYILTYMRMCVYVYMYIQMCVCTYSTYVRVYVCVYVCDSKPCVLLLNCLLSCLSNHTYARMSVVP